MLRGLIPYHTIFEFLVVFLFCFDFLFFFPLFISIFISLSAFDMHSNLFYSILFISFHYDFFISLYDNSIFRDTLSILISYSHLGFKDFIVSISISLYISFSLLNFFTLFHVYRNNSALIDIGIIFLLILLPFLNF